jgi:hypothetical protein
MALGNADDLVRTWTHESLHARQPFDLGAPEEVRLFQGYEEGLVELLARLVVRDMYGLHPLERSYEYYVAAYETLAQVAQVSADALCRSLWLCPTGSVRRNFVDSLDSTRHERIGLLLSIGQRARLRAAADQVFATSRRGDVPGRDAMLAMWRIALKP